MDKPVLHKLSSELVNQIAAGEVIERPSSVVKELVDNAIDAGAKNISIRVNNGGMSLIEVSDDGIGIPKNNLESVFDAHTTSKINSIEDLNELLSMGFRGEALSTITSVAKVSLISKYIGEETANEIKYDENGKSNVKSSARESGTLVKVEDLFYNIPARRKYLKSEQTEYRKIYELFLKYTLIFPNIHFTLVKDGKNIEDLKIVSNSKAGEVVNERLSHISQEELLKLFYNGSGININGYVAHPSSHKSRSSKQYVFVNKRAITDSGITRAVYEGYARYLPFGERVPFVINIDIKPELVDVNVHPRKEEVRFENPFRIYSAVTDAVKHTLEKVLSYSNVPSKENTFEEMRNTYNQKPQVKNTQEYTQQEISFNKEYTSVKDSLLFSKEALQFTPQTYFEEKVDAGNMRNIFQLFNKYILIEFDNEIVWVIDQHAAAERINFEKISRREKDSINIQNILVPTNISFSKEELLFLSEYKEFFSEIGFTYILNTDGISLSTIPAEFSSNPEDMFREIFELVETPELLIKNFEKLKHDLLATIACHNSVRSGQKLERLEMINLYNQLKACENPYSCPHGRPAIWKLKLSDIDKNFERTY